MFADNFILSLENIELDRKHCLPNCSGIYYVIDSAKTIWYIGRSVNINRRWNGEKIHHRYEQLLSLAVAQKTVFFIYYDRVPAKQINKKEKKAIVLYQPLLNNTPIDRSFVRSSKQDNFINLPILSDFSKLPQYDRVFIEDNFYMETEIKSEPLYLKNPETQEIKKFNRKFIQLRDDKINLNFELEICIDRQARFFVRHHTCTYIAYRDLKIVDKLKPESIEEDIHLNVTSRLIKSRNPFRWLGYKLNCENILLIDEEDTFEIETLAIMMPFRMFIDFLEDIWIKTLNPSTFKEEETSWFQQRDLCTKIAKYLYDRNITAIDLVKELNVSSQNSETNIT
jgi:hypothetical protein